MVLRWQRRGRVGRRRDLMMRKPQRPRWGFRFLSGPSHRCAVGAARPDRRIEAEPLRHSGHAVEAGDASTVRIAPILPDPLEKSVNSRRATLPVTEQILKNSAPIADIATLRHLYCRVYRFRRPLVAKRPGNASMDSNPEKRNPAQSFTGETPVPRA